MLTEPIKDLDDNFWSTVNSNYTKLLRENESSLKNILVDGFKTDEDEYDLYIANYEDEIYKFSKKLIVKCCSDLNSHLNRKFNSYFKNDDKGKHRNWKDIPEEKIQQLFEECYNQFDKVYDQFHEIELPKRPNAAEITMGNGSMYKKKDSLLSSEDITKIKDKFSDDCNHALEEAMRLHHNIYGGGIPVYFWAVFLFFAYDDIFRWLSSPILFYPLLFVLTLAGLLQSLGILMPMMKTASVTLKVMYAQVVNSR